VKAGCKRIKGFEEGLYLFDADFYPRLPGSKEVKE
jgi:hypothetical protein